MSDLFGFTPPQAPFIDIRNTRASSAQEKAALLLILGRLLNKCPASVNSGGIEYTRRWIDARKAAAKVAASKRASVNEISSAISAMEGFANPSANGASAV